MKIRLQDLTKQYGSTTALHHLNLDIHDGEFLVILGSSGSGKSTTLNMLAGLEEPTSGYIFFHERMVNHVPPGKRDVALVFQNYALYPHMRAYDNIVFPLKMRKAGDSHQKVTKTAEMLGIDALLQKYPKELSGGERQRVALARALVRNPQIFLMDEPLSNLDARLRISARGELKKLHRERNITTVYVTHDQTEALTLGNRIAVMDKGGLQQIGTPNEVYQKPRNMFVAGFIGMPPMNMAQISIGNPHSFNIGGVVVEFPALLPDTKDVILGIRPERLTLVPPHSPHVITGKIVHREYLGSESISHVEITKNILWYVKGDAAEGTKTGDMVGLQFSPEDTHWFDRVTRARIKF
ncbi:MAG: sn-glycerol-3-phosphate ABC transporter ATP-binding protein UgpC [Candidatus Brocadia carolinensis]|uniref:sn-glycerol-3-phosphate ABC transporter ATP-binding protein UgpC n=1 Tax=Candidatus Brocadia carolinensis TaxID=1004156 RepID=A0A1V4AQ51_9BACT|nr:MAG: sn-glycerol-3-phosphate ABC transporter ATP-binding protein UgpC [Candidatus Brocadia caroliniensis]